MKILLALIFGFCMFFSVKAQKIPAPNYVLKSHPTLEILKVERNESGLIFYMSIQNELSTGGSFCIDRNTFLIVPGKKLKLKKTEGIPECPENFNFEYPGQHLEFQLFFPELDKDIRIFDIREDCTSNCFWFSGVVVDENLNNKLDAAFLDYENGFLLQALSEYKQIYTSVDKELPSIAALCIFYMSGIEKELKNFVEYKKWKEKLGEMNSPEAQTLFSRLD